MNRKQRRATQKHGSSAAGHRSDSTGEQINQLIFEAAECERRRKFDDAVRLYKRVLLLRPDHAEVCNNLGRVFQLQGKPKDASHYFARALAQMPQLLENNMPAFVRRSLLCCRHWAKHCASKPPPGRGI